MVDGLDKKCGRIGLDWIRIRILCGLDKNARQIGHWMVGGSQYVPLVQLRRHQIGSDFPKKIFPERIFLSPKIFTLSNLL